MKKNIIILVMGLMVFACGCGKSSGDKTKEAANVNTEAPSQTQETEAPGQSQETEAPSQTQTTEIPAQSYDFASELAGLEDAEGDLLEKANGDGVTQAEMNTYAGEIYKLWDDELNKVWAMLPDYLSESDIESLKTEQKQWIKDRDKKMDEAEAECGGGSMAALQRSSEGSDLTKARVYELVEKLTGLKLEK